MQLDKGKLPPVHIELVLIPVIDAFLKIRSQFPDQLLINQMHDDDFSVKGMQGNEIPDGAPFIIHSTAAFRK